jgi:hypothetical protein
MKGEYTGSDGQTYRWVKDGSGEYRIEIQHWTASTTGVQGSALPQAIECWITYGAIAPADIDAAFAALRELQEEGEWVEWETTEGYHYRADVNGNVQRNLGSGWGYASPPVEGAYRTGLETGRKEAQELADLILGTIEYDNCLMTAKGRSDALALARKVKGE